MSIIINIKGAVVRALHSDLFPWNKLGKPVIKRYSNIEFNNSTRKWEVKRRGTVMFQNAKRTTCLEWEKRHFANCE